MAKILFVLFAAWCNRAAAAIQSTEHVKQLRWQEQPQEEQRVVQVRQRRPVMVEVEEVQQRECEWARLCRDLPRDGTFALPTNRYVTCVFLFCYMCVKLRLRVKNFLHFSLQASIATKYHARFFVVHEIVMFIQSITKFYCFPFTPFLFF